MVLLELKKFKRKKLTLVFAIIVIVGATVQYFIGSMTYNGVAYGNELGWFFKGGLILNSYYLFIPVISLMGMELFVLELSVCLLELAFNANIMSGSFVLLYFAN